MLKRSLAGVGLATLVWTGCTARDGERSIEEFAKSLDESIPKVLDECMVPGAAVALIRDGEVVHQKGYGFADLANKTPVTVDTGFNIGSISKTVAAWGLLKLVEDGKVELDAPAARYVESWKLPDSEFDADGVTLRRLLSHTAGLSLHGYPGFGPDDELPTLPASLSGRTNGSGDVHLSHAPGTKWKYSGGGYTIAQLMVEDVTGRKFAEFMREEILRPLGMKRSDYELTESILAGSSLCYDALGLLTPNPRFTAEAAAGLHTTIADLATFAAAALEAKDRKAGRGVLTPATVQEMMKPALASARYGLGYSVGETPDGHRYAGHGGSNRGWQALLRVVPATGDGIVVVTNGSNGQEVLKHILGAWTEWLTGEKPRLRIPFAMPIVRALMKDGPGAAEQALARVREAGLDRYRFDEYQLNRVGYALLQKKRVDDAITIFELNVKAYPNAFNPYDSLGEAFMVAGKRELAIANYEKSLELNPKNEGAKRMLEKLKHP